MINGRINWLLEATVYVEIQDAAGGLHRFECILDTGFDGDIALPLAAIRRLGLVLSGRRFTILGNGDGVFMYTYVGTALWHGGQTQVTVLQTAGESAIGMSLLENNTITMQVWDGGDVLIEERARL